jgi:hypothetical protein
LCKNEATLFIDEVLTNLSPEPMEFMWGHHPAFGAPFLKEGCRIFVPAKCGEVHTPRFAESSIFEPGQVFPWPLIQKDGQVFDLSCIPSDKAGFADLIYLSELEEGWYAVIDPERSLGFGLSWPKEIFPYLWFWMVYGRAPGYPWWDQVYCIALEPWTSIPNSLNLAIERKTQSCLRGGGSTSVHFAATVITGRNSVTHIDQDGNVSGSISTQLITTKEKER